MSDPWQAYFALIQKLDSFFARVQELHPGALQCASGCATCCQRDISLFPFELARLVEAVEQLEPAARGRVVHRARETFESEDGFCPLLEDDRCVVYQARSVICRTHGLPSLFGPEGEQELSLCPLNFKEVAELSGDSVLDLNPVNQALATINHLLCAQQGQNPERVRISEALLAAFDIGDGEG